MDIYRSKGNLAEYLQDIPWPTDFFASANLPEFLSKIYILDHQWRVFRNEFQAEIWIAIDGETAVRIPGLDGVSLVAGGNLTGYTFVTTQLKLGAKSELALRDIRVALRFDKDVLTPAPTISQPIPPPYAEISITGSVRVDSNFNVSVDGFNAIDLTPVYIGNTGIVISATSVKLDLSRTTTIPEVLAAGFGDDFIGVYIGEAKVTLPKDFPALAPQDLVLKKCVIGSGGVSGKLEAHYSPVYEATSKTFTGNGAGTLFGIPFGLKDIELEFKQNTFRKSEIIGKLVLPFFDEPVDVDIGIGLDGGFTVKLANTGPNGLYKLTKTDVLEIELDSIGFEIKDGLFKAKLSGEITPLFGKDKGLKWPAFKVQELSIDSKGHVHLDGGWLDLPKQYGLDFHGFKVSITKLGMGRNENGTKWIGFSGSVKLVDGLPGGGSVDGLRITADENWSLASAKISFNGVGVELDAKAFYFKGAVSYREFDQGTTKVHRFDGDIKLKLRSPELTIDGNLVIGSVGADGPKPAYNFFAIYVGVDLPTGIALGTTGLGLYGIAGLLAINMEPDKKPDEAWYGIGDVGWYKKPKVGLTDLKAKWVNTRGSKAFGAGVTIGTYADNGYIFSGRVLLAIVFPGPMILIEGMANLLKDRSKLTSVDDPLFRALAVLDNQAGSLLIGLDVKYKYNQKTGRLIKISAGTEAYYEFGNPNAWHIYLGIKEPRERRIQADILDLFSANAYLMLNARQLAMGAWVGYDRSWTFKPLSVTLQAWMEANAVVSFKPAHLYADLWVHGAVDLKVFGFGLGLTLDAKLAADVFDPFHVLGEFAVGIKLPWPFNKKKIEAHVKLEWGPEPAQPPIPAPLKDVSIEHFKTTTKWPLPNPTLLAPVYTDDDGFLSRSPTLDELAGPPTNTPIPIVALDCRPSLGFARNVNDDAQVGAIVQPLNPDSEQIGDPARGEGPCRVRYGLQELRLDKWDGSAWKSVAGKGGASAALPEKIFGTWAPVDGIGAKSVGQSKLLLWSKTGFDHMRHTGTEWSDWFAGTHPTFPCLPISRTCLDFESFDSNKLYPSPLTHPKRSDVHFTAEQTGQPQSFWVSALDNPIAGKRRALRTTWPGRITISFDNPVNNLRIAAAPGPPLAVSIDPVEKPIPVLGTPGKPPGAGLAPAATVVAAVPTAVATPIGPVKTPPITSVPLAPKPVTSVPTTVGPITPAPTTPVPIAPKPITSVPAKPGPAAVGPAAPGPITPGLITPGPGVVPPPDQMPITVIVQDQSGRQFGPFPLVDNVIDLKVSNIKSAVLLAPGPLLPSRDGTVVPRAPGIVSVLEVCATFAPLSEARASVRIDNIAIFDPARGAMFPFFSENFDGVTAPALPAGWTTASDGSGRPWATSATNPASGPNDAFAPETNDIGETALVTPIIAISFAGAVLTFQSLFNLDASATAGVGLDGMVLEISINGGAFIDITHPMAGGSFFVKGGYTHTISADFDSPLGGQPAWSGLSAGKTAAPAYLTTEVKLAAVAVAGQNIQLKWRVATDNRAGSAAVPPTDPNANAAALAESIRLHNLSASKSWTDKGNVLEPYTNYRLRIVTTTKVDNNSPRQLPQLAYFQTKGPPGLSTLTKPTEPPYPPDLVDPSGLTNSKGALDDLTLYVHQTIPPTVPKTGELPLLPRPVYRGYDVGVLFNEDYVDLMYRLAGRDLALLLYDRNNQPVRDRSGRLVVLDNPWGVTEKLSFNAQETPWIALLNGSPCLTPIDPKSVPRDQTLQAAHEAQILDPDTLYDARLMPLLVHEDFSRIPEGPLGRWKPKEFIAPGGSSHWQIEKFGSPEAYRMVHTPSPVGLDPSWLGSMLVLGAHPGLSAPDLSQPSMWSDYRLSLYLRSSDASAIAIGAAFRYADPDNFYLFTMDRTKGARQLLRVKKEGTTPTAVTLAEDQFTYDVNHDYHLVVEAIGDSLRIYLEDTLIFDVTDATIKSGGVAFQCSTSRGAAFSDIQVHDFSQAAKSVYHFPFTTSAFVDFFHHLHSFDDECWPATCKLTDAELTALDARSAAKQNSPISDDEARAFQRLADDVLGTSANQVPARTEITGINRKGGKDSAVFLLRTPEPIDWMRTSISWAFSKWNVPSPLTPRSAKFVAASLGSKRPENENITLLVREALNPTGYRIEKREVPAVAGGGPPTPELDDPASTWTLVYQFGSENLIAPGTQVVVNSGNPDKPPPAVPRVLQRFRAPTGTPGDVQLAANAVDLRLVDSKGKVVHARRFLNDTTGYNSVAFHVLRKADGTAFFLLPAGFPAAGFSPGTYQMTMMFRRDNKAIDPNSIILSAAGQTAPETVVLGVPSSTVQLAT
jgi:hypothetical protein